MKRLHAGLRELFPCKGKILPGGFQCAPGKTAVIVLQRMGGMGFNTGEQKVLKGMVVYPGLNIVKVPHKAVSIPSGPCACGAEAVPEAGAQDKVQPPLGLLHQPQVQRRTGPAPPRALKQRLYNLPGLGRLLGLVPRIVPAAGITEQYSLMPGNDILVAGAVLSRHRETAALAVEEVYRLP